MADLLRFADALALILASVAINSVVLGACLVPVVWIVLRLLPGRGAATRYLVWGVTLVAVLLLGLTGIPSVTDSTAPAGGQGSTNGRTASLTDPGDPSMRETDPRLAGPVYEALPAGKGERPWLPAAGFAVWAVAALAMLARVAQGCLSVRRLKRSAAPAPEAIQRRLKRHLRRGERWIRLCVSDRIPGPVATGLANPAIVLPAAMLLELTDEELDQAILHELAHLRRGDDWANLVQRVVQSLFFFHPVVHLVCGQLEQERELACDEAVVAATGEPHRYAAFLGRLASLLRHTDAREISFGVAGGRGKVLARVESILSVRRRPAALAEALCRSVAFGTVLVVAIGCSGFGPVVDLPRGPEAAARLAVWQRALIKVVWGDPFGDALGPATRVTIICDKSTWEGMEEEIRGVFESRTKTPQPEQLFKVEYGGEAAADTHLRWRQLVLLASLDRPGRLCETAASLLDSTALATARNGSFGLAHRRDIWANGQTVVALVAGSLAGQREALLTEADRMRASVTSGLREELADALYSGLEPHHISRSLEERFGWRVRVPFRFTLLDERADSGFVAFCRQRPKMSQWLFVYWEDGAEPGDITEDYCIRKRDEVTRRFFEGDRIVRSELNLAECEFSGKLAVRMEGVWENPNTWQGGPFRCYTFVDPDRDRLYVVDTGVFAPNKEKLIYLEQMAEIASSFEFVQQAGS
jgi:beta-lactamase regulating signal transducer with metallopeptidase domain